MSQTNDKANENVYDRTRRLAREKQEQKAAQPTLEQRLGIGQVDELAERMKKADQR